MMMGFELIILVGVIAYALGWRPQINLPSAADNSQGPKDILKARYASGEISREEYERVRQDLEG